LICKIQPKTSHLGAGSTARSGRRQLGAAGKRRQARPVCRFCVLMRRVTAVIVVVMVALLIGLQETGLLSGSDDNPNAVETNISTLDR
jgi:hypothetical protein